MQSPLILYLVRDNTRQQTKPFPNSIQSAFNQISPPCRMEQSGRQNQCCHGKKMECVLAIGYLQAQIIRPSAIRSIHSQQHLLSKSQSFCLIPLCKLNSRALTFFINQRINYSKSTIKVTPQTYLLITNNSTLNAQAITEHKHKLHSLLQRQANSEIVT